MIFQTVRGMLEGIETTASFRGALASIDADSMCSSLALREPLSKIVVATPVLLQRNFRRHSAAELATSETLQSIAGTLKTTPLRDALLRHSGDELRHSRMFQAIADGMTASAATDEDTYDWILEKDRQFVADYNGDIVEFVCDLFAGEVRTFFFVRGYIEALRAADSINMTKMSRILEKILDDERRHIGYTGCYINQWMGEGIDLTQSLRRSFGAFDRNSWVEVAATAEFFYASPQGGINTFHIQQPVS